MKTLFALLGLFMFASVSSTDLTTTKSNNEQKSSLSLESGDNTTGGVSKGRIIIGM